MFKVQYFESSGVNRMGLNLVVVRITSKPTANSAVHPSKVGKRVLKSEVEDTSSNSAGPHQLYSCCMPNLP